MPAPIVLLTHTDADREVCYPAPALAALRGLAEVRLNPGSVALHGDALILAAAGAQIIVADRRTAGEAALFAASTALVAFVRGAADIGDVDVPGASAMGVLVTQASAGLAQDGDADPLETTRQVAAILQGRVPVGAVNGEAAHRLRRFAPKLAPEVGGTEGPEPTRYGDWQHKGRVTDF